MTHQTCSAAGRATGSGSGARARPNAITSAARIALLLAACRSASPQPATIAPDPLRAASGEWHVLGRSVDVVDLDGRSALRFDERRGMGLAWDPRLALADGEIECDVRGRDLAGKSFVGLAFRIADNTRYSAVYLRPFNFRAQDATKHGHAVQYITEPEHPWEQLRAQHPGLYEAAVTPEPDPDDWVHLRVSLHGPEIRVFVNRSAQPALTVQDLGGRSSGGVGFWAGDESDGAYANLRITPCSER